MEHNPDHTLNIPSQYLSIEFALVALRIIFIVFTYRSLVIMSRTWFCCQCGAANIDGTAPERCPICQHFKCAGCSSRPRNSFQSLSNYTAAEPRYVPCVYSSNDTFSPASGGHASRCQSYTYSSDRGNSSSAPIRSHGRPDMTGWWVCSECQNTINPALASSRCPICAHSRCLNCRDL